MLIVTPFFQFVSSFLEYKPEVGIGSALMFYVMQWRFVLTFVVLSVGVILLKHFINYVSASPTDDSINIR
jgi:hypothetical protein